MSSSAAVRTRHELERQVSADRPPGGGCDLGIHDLFGFELQLRRLHRVLRVLSEVHRMGKTATWRGKIDAVALLLLFDLPGAVGSGTFCLLAGLETSQEKVNSW